MAAKSGSGESHTIVTHRSMRHAAVLCGRWVERVAEPWRVLAALAIGGLLATTCAVARGDTFTTFESGQVRPLAMSPDGSRLFALNTPDDRLEIFAVSEMGLTRSGSVPVGLEPVAVAARTNGEVWVVNHLSDSVSVVDVAAEPPRVVRTLLVGDEPSDIVFAGPEHSRAFITAAHRGQNAPFDPQLTTPGIGRADVWVFDAADLGQTLGGRPLNIITLFGDTPRALAATADGNTVMAAVFHSGNRTTAVSEGAVCDGGEAAPPCSVRGTVMPGGLPGPDTNVEGVARPETGLIVKYNPETDAWEDQLARDWSAAVRFRLPDTDVFAIDASADPPVEKQNFAGVGTVLFNMAINPATGLLYVSNTQANNEVRFEGPGLFGGSTVRGHLHEARITVIDPHSGAVSPRHLNKHIDYAIVPSPPDIKASSLATPLGLAVSGDGQLLYVAGFGSSAIGVFHTAELEQDTFIPDPASHIVVQGGGPTGLALDEAHNRLYVFTRFDNALSVIDTTAGAEIDHLTLHNPEPRSVVDGRRFLYDARLTSSNGEASCASCHVFADMDDLAWDLGNPDGSVVPNPNPNRANNFVPPPATFHPMKGPMTTQTLRGLANHGPMHWRGDRTGGNAPGGDPLDEKAAFMAFNVAFEGLLGREAQLTEAEMRAFTDFALQVVPAPNPIRALDNSLTPDQEAGRTVFFGSVMTAGDLACINCHAVDRSKGFFGTDGFSADPINFDDFSQFRTMKIPQLRNMYAKVGMFGMPAVRFIFDGGNEDMGDQIRGFGFMHDGSEDTIFRHLREGGVEPNPFDRPRFSFPGGDVQRRQVEQFVFAFDSNLAPIVGQQVTLTRATADVAAPRIELLIARAAAGECDVVVKGVSGGEQRGWYRNAAGVFISDRIGDEAMAEMQLRALALLLGEPLTYTCVPPGSGERLGVDRDGDHVFDRDELDAGSDPADPASIPCRGDCNNDRQVTVDELVTLVNIALSATPMSTCRVGDVNHDGAVTIDELMLAVNRAVTACPAGPDI
jgi:YVTN family beta-propeller protein